MIVKPLSWTEAIDAAEHELELAAISDARLNAELLAAHALGVWTRGEVREQSKELLLQQDLDLYQSLVRRRIRHEPLQYITGQTEFFGLRLYCSPAALIPRPDTEILVEESLREASHRNDGLRMLDIGTGSGCIALAIASKLRDAAITGIDLSADALALAEKNRKRCQLENVAFKPIDIHTEAGMSALDRFDLVVSNPPYIPLPEYLQLEPEVRDHEPRSALTDEADGLSFYKEIFRISPVIVKPQGRLLLEIGHGAKDRVIALAENFTFVRSVKDLAGIDRVIVFEQKK